MPDDFNFAFADNTFICHSLRQRTVRILHHKIATLISAVLVVFTGGMARGEHVMSKNLKASRPEGPPVYTTRSGSRYVRAIDVIRSVAGRRELSLQLKNQPKRSLKVARLSKAKT